MINQANKQKRESVAHLVILKREYINEILSGDKSIESRFMKRKGIPFGKISRGDKLFFKISAGPVCASGEVEKVKCVKNLTSEKIKQIRKQYGNLIGGTKEYWKTIEEKRFCVLIWLKNTRPIAEKKINKRDRRAWVILSKSNGYGLI